MKNNIDSLISGKEAYAYARLSKTSGYGHMIVTIRLTSPEWGFRPNGVIKITCQIGSEGGGSQCEKPYAIRYGLDSNADVIQLEELYQATKMMKKISKYLDKIANENDDADNYAEYCQRILLGSGVKLMIVEPDNWVNGGRMCDKKLINVGAASKAKLRDMELDLISKFTRLAA